MFNTTFSANELIIVNYHTLHSNLSWLDATAFKNPPYYMSFIESHSTWLIVSSV